MSPKLVKEKTSSKKRKRMPTSTLGRRHVPGMTPDERSAAIERRSSFKGTTSTNGTKLSSLRAIAILSLLSIAFVEGPGGKSAWETAAQTNLPCIFLCLLCGHLFNARGNSVISLGRACPFCCYNPMKICKKSENCELCIERSVDSLDIVELLAKRFVEYDDAKNDIPACEISRSSHVKCWWKCTKPGCEHSFDAAPADITRPETTNAETSRTYHGTGCPYCCRKSEKFCPVETGCASCVARSLASKALAEEIVDHAIPVTGPLEKDGTRRPLEETAQQCNKKCLFLCPDVPDHGEFSATSNAVVGSNGNGCPKCVNKSEDTMLTFLEKALSEIHGCTWKRQGQTPSSGTRKFDMIIRFDNGTTVVVEIDGAQHFKVVRFSRSKPSTPEVQRGVDVEKTLAAQKDGVSVVRIATHGDDRVVRGKRLERLGGALVEAAKLVSRCSYPVVIALDLDSPGCYAPFLADLLK